MKTNNDTLNAIQTMVSNAVDNAGYNSTRNAVIVSRNANNTYNIKMDGVDYKNVVCYGCGILLAGEVAKVVIPNGQASQMFVLAINPYPVGSIYQTTDANFDPNVVWGGTWQKIEGKVLVGWDEDDTDFDTVGETGGAKERTLSATIGACNNSISSLGYITESATTYQNSHNAGYVVTGSNMSFSKWNHSTPVVEATSSSRNVSMLQPYEVVVIWKRTA